MTLKSAPQKSPQHVSIVNQTIAKPRSAIAVLYVVEEEEDALPISTFQFVAFRELVSTTVQKD